MSIVWAIGFFRNFIQQYSQMMYPYYQLLKKDNEWEWNEAHMELFQVVKGKLLLDMELAIPSYTQIVVGFSSGMLYAKPTNKERNGSFASRTHNAQELYNQQAVEGISFI